MPLRMPYLHYLVVFNEQRLRATVVEILHDQLEGRTQYARRQPHRHSHLKAARTSIHSPRTVIKAKRTTTTLRAVDQALHPVISFTRGRAVARKCCSPVEIPGKWHLKWGCPTPPSDTASTSLCCKEVKRTAIRPHGLAAELFCLAAVNLHEARFRGRTASRRPRVQVQPQLRLAPARAWREETQGSLIY